MSKLRRSVTFLQALSINISAIIGAGIFTVSGVAAGLAGPSSILAIAIGALIAIFTGMSFAELAHMYAREGGNYEYAREVLGGYAGYIAGFIWIIATIVSGAAVAISFGGYLDSIIKIAQPEILAAILVGVLGTINYFGIKHSARLSLLLILVNISVLIFFVVVGVFFVKPSNFVPFFPNGIGGVLAASSFIFFAYTGFARITMLGEEIEEPKKTIPKAIILSIAISALIYVLVMFALIGMAPYSTIANSEFPLAQAIYFATHNPLIEYIISVGAMIATINVDLTMVLGLSRVIFAMARDNDLPKPFAKLNRHGAPDRAILFSSLLMIAAIFTINFKNIIAFSNGAALTSYAIANLAAIKLSFVRRKNRRRMLFKSNYFIFVPIIGFLLTLTMFSFLTRFSIMLTFWTLIIITFYYILAKAERERLGLPPAKYKKMPRKRNW
jgi:APA family basic amino acid/polyamine antiporter